MSEMCVAHIMTCYENHLKLFPKITMPYIFIILQTNLNIFIKKRLLLPGKVSKPSKCTKSILDLRIIGDYEFVRYIRARENRLHDFTRFSPNKRHQENKVFSLPEM